MLAKLILEDQTILPANHFGAQVNTAGEVVFTTAMTGYIESLTDPSYKGQILVFTYPLIGNYGVPATRFFQSNKIQVSGVIVSENCLKPNHSQSKKSLHQWLLENNLPGLSGIDTRALTQKIREKGTLLGKILTNSSKVDFYDPNKENLVPKVSCSKPKFYQQNSAKTICLLDCGVKKAILNHLLQRKINVWQVPWDYNPFQNPQIKFHGLLISNGR